MNIQPIRNEADHAAALERMEVLWNAEPGSDEAAELDAIATLVDAYEAKILAIPPGQPHEILRYAVAEMGRSEEELAILVGTKALAGRVLSGDQPLTVEMIRNISATWHIPVDLLIGSSSTTTPTISKRLRAARFRAEGRESKKQRRDSAR
jgi:HTH-type transcriptional regulator/antitoxin HigA